MMSIDKMNGGSNSFSNGRKRSQRRLLLLLLVLALGAGTVSVMLMHKLREGRALGLTLQDQDRQISTLQLSLQKERENSKEMKRKLENLKAKYFLMSTQKLELSNKLADTQTAAYQLQNKMETALKEKQNQIKGLSELLKLRDAEVREMKQQLEEKPRAAENNTSPHEAKESKWVKVQTNIDDGPLEDGGKLEEKPRAAENNTSPHDAKESKWVKIQTNIDDGPLEDGGEEASEDQHNANAANFNGDIEMRQESTMEVKEQSIEPTNDQETPAAAQYREENSPKEPTRDAEGKGHKVHRNRNRGRGIRQRSVSSSIKTESPRADGAKNENSDDKAEAARNLDTENMGNAEKREVTYTSVLQQTDADNAAAGDGSTKVQGHSTDHDVRREGKKMASKHEQSGKSANLQEDEAKNENNNDETGASAKGESSNSEIQDAAVKEETDVNTTSITEQGGDVNTESVTKEPDTDNADDNHQTKV